MVREATPSKTLRQQKIEALADWLAELPSEVKTMADAKEIFENIKNKRRQMNGDIEEGANIKPLHTGGLKKKIKTPKGIMIIDFHERVEEHPQSTEIKFIETVWLDGNIINQKIDFAEAGSEEETIAKETHLRTLLTIQVPQEEITLKRAGSIYSLLEEELERLNSPETSDTGEKTEKLILRFILRTDRGDIEVSIGRRSKNIYCLGILNMNAAAKAMFQEKVMRDEKNREKAKKSVVEKDPIVEDFFAWLNENKPQKEELTFEEARNFCQRINRKLEELSHANRDDSLSGEEHDLVDVYGYPTIEINITGKGKIILKIRKNGSKYLSWPMGGFNQLAIDLLA